MAADIECSKLELARFDNEVIPDHRARPLRTVTEILVHRETESDEFGWIKGWVKGEEGVSKLPVPGK